MGGEAYATCRCLPGQYESENCQEWAATAKFEGKEIKIFWIFKNEDCQSEDAGDYPWMDADSVSRVVEIEDGEEGEEIA